MGLFLQAIDVAGPLKWRWLLTDEETGAPLADHRVDLDPASDEVARFADLYAYVRWRAAPDRWLADGARIVMDAGAWAGRELVGELVGQAIAAATTAGPVTVRVTAARLVEQILLWPLELAHADGRPLAARGDVMFVYDITGGTRTGANGARKPDASGTVRVGTGLDEARAVSPLRILAVFSQPTETDVLALRRERYRLSQLIRRITARHEAAVELRVVQYGTTREALARIADHGDGWDILHMSGHGDRGVFLLEKPDGSPDVVSAADLVALLRPARRRAKLAVVSACKSAADATEQTYRLLGLTAQAEALEAVARTDGAASGGPTRQSGTGREAPIPGLARMLVRELGCAVVAMRYPVSDEFSVAVADELYDRLLLRRQPVDVAVARAVAEVGSASLTRYPAICLATPGVFGGSAAGLRLAVPRGRANMDPAEQEMAFFPREPARFVGRALEMAKASAALASASGRSTVFLHGMAGAGKTTCALELAYRHRDSFTALAFWQAPTREGEWESALADFANRLEIQLGGYGFRMASHIGTEASLNAFLPRLQSIMANQGILLVLDNLESLLTPAGAWRDPRWAGLIAALTSHDGESRVVLTSRIPPAALVAGSPSGPVVQLPVHALSLAESAALARELPNLRALMHADPGPTRTGRIEEPGRLREDARELAAAGGDDSQGADAGKRNAGASPGSRTEAADRDRIRRVLRVVQGHPKLLELADAAADDRGTLDAHLVAAEKAIARDQTGGKALEAFFRDGTSTWEPRQFLEALSTWTVTALGALSREARLIAEFVACLEDGDRRSDVVEATWPGLWRRLAHLPRERRPTSVPEQPAMAAVPERDDPFGVPGPGPLLAVLAASALVDADPLTLPGPVGGAAPGDKAGAALRMHPGVAAAISAQAGPEIREAVDAELGAYWKKEAGKARDTEGGEDSSLVVRAGLAAAPYLLRRADWSTVGFLLEQAALRDISPGFAQAALPSLRWIVAVTETARDAARLGRVLSLVDPGEAERVLRDAVTAGAGSGDYRAASAAAGILIDLLLDAGRTEEAFEAVGWVEAFAEQGAFGPWARLSAQSRRLQVLSRVGEHRQALAEADRLLADMADLPDHPDDDQDSSPWDVRESVLDGGRSSAFDLGELQRSLDLNAQVVESERRRNADVYTVATTQLYDVAPLVELERWEEAEQLLARCQQVFEDHDDMTGLARLVHARAEIEARHGHKQAAADQGRNALRMFYDYATPEDIAIGHRNLAGYLGKLGGARAEELAHKLAGMLIFRCTGLDYNLEQAVRELAGELRQDGGTENLPAAVTQVIEFAELTGEVRFGALLNTLQPDSHALQEALTEIIRDVASGADPAAGEPG